MSAYYDECFYDTFANIKDELMFTAEQSNEIYMLKSYDDVIRTEPPSASWVDWIVICNGTIHFRNVEKE